MNFRQYIFIVILLLIPASIGCSNSAESPIGQSLPDQNDISALICDNSSLLGLWAMEFNPDTCAINVTPDRTLMANYNLTLLLPSPSISVVSYDQYSGILTTNVTIANPFPVSGRDLRLIIYSDTYGSRLKNADDWIDMYDIPGGAQINPFVAYAKNVENRVFGAHTQHTRRVEFYFPSGITGLNFAITASAPDNCLEAYEISNFAQLSPLYGGDLWSCRLYVDVFDWQNDVLFVDLHCPAITGEDSVKMTRSGSPPFYFYRDQVNVTCAPAGEYPGYVDATSLTGEYKLYDFVTITVKPNRATSHYQWVSVQNFYVRDVVSDNQGNCYVCGYKDVTAQNRDIILEKIDSNSNLIWSFQIGGEDEDDAQCIDINIDGNIIMGGEIYGKVDLDPGPDEYYLDNSYSSKYIAEYDPDGHLVWAQGFGSYHVTADDITCDIDGNLYMVGYFSSNTDFDPGPGQFIINTTNDRGYITKFDADGNWQWASKTCDELIATRCNAVGVDNTGNPYFCGYASGNGGYLSSMSQDGNFRWERAWKGSECRGVAISNDNYAYVVGDFRGTVDFDPGDGTEFHTSGDLEYDAFLTAFNSSGDWQWVKVWGDSDDDRARHVEIANSGNVFIYGTLGSNQDIDPGPEEFYIDSVWYDDCFISEFDSKGNFIWGHSWGAKDNEYSYAFDIGNDNKMFLIGFHQYEICDYDPGPGNDIIDIESNYKWLIMYSLD